MMYKNVYGRSKKGSIILAHGLGEHSQRYDHLISMMTTNGYQVSVFDWPGHGKSTGKRGDTSIEKGVDILDSLIKSVQEKPFLFGHSMGGLTVLRYAEQHAEKIRGIITSSPQLSYDTRIHPRLIKVSSILSYLLPFVTVNNRINPEELTRNTTAVTRYIHDPLVHDRLTLSLHQSMTINMNQAYEQADKITCPTLVFVGTHDRIVPMMQTKKVFEKIRTNDKELVECRDAYHEIINDPEYKDIVQDRMIAWMNTH